MHLFQSSWLGATAPPFDDVEAFAFSPQDPNTIRSAVEMFYMSNDVLEMISRKRGDESFEGVANALGHYYSETWNDHDHADSDNFSKLQF